MKKIVGIIHPFDLNQTLYVFEDGKSLEVTQATLEDLSITIFNLAQAYEVEQIDFSGPRDFTEGIIRDIKEKELTKYNKNKLTIKRI